jgi:hypothetical protein
MRVRIPLFVLPIAFEQVDVGSAESPATRAIPGTNWATALAAGSPLMWNGNSVSRAHIKLEMRHVPDTAKRPIN